MMLPSFKALNGHLHVDFFQFLDFYSQDDRYLPRHFDTKSLKKKYARTKFLKTVTFIGLWMNGPVLPLEVRSACNVDKFKASVIKFVTKL